MRHTLCLAALGLTLMASTALAQAPANQQRPANATAAAAQTNVQGWRASKLIGVDVYNNQNEKIGDINELIVDKSGKISGVVIGAGGFLGMGEHDVMVDMAKLKFMDEPVRSSDSRANDRRDANAPNANRTSGTARTDSNDKRWYPDHAVLDTTKEQLKAMPQIKY